MDKLMIGPLDPEPSTECVLCGHPFAERHRITPGHLGGQYVEGNVIELCPNHHAAAHYLMASFRASVSGDPKFKSDDARWERYMLDRPLQCFWNLLAKPVAVQHLVALGLWHPYRTGEFVPVESSRRSWALRAFRNQVAKFRKTA